MIQKLQRLLLLSVIFSIPVQLGKHFWPPFSFISGIRVDYLSPTLYVSDLLIIFLFITWIFELMSSSELRRNVTCIARKKIVYIVFTVCFLLTFNFIVLSHNAYFFGVLKLFEFFFFSVFVSYRFRRCMIKSFMYGIVSIALFETALASFQLVLQRSVGGFFYYVGERTYDVFRFGIAKFEFFDTAIVRPYGTFPHPNVLAFFLLFSVSLFLFYFFSNKQPKRFLLYVVLSLLSFGILITFSRTAILCFFVLLLWFAFKHFASRLYFFIVGTFLFGILFTRFESISFVRDFEYRIELLQVSYNVFSEHFLFGVGLNNYLYHQVLFQKDLSPVLLQPVHNIFVLVLLQVGIVGLMLVAHFLYLTLRNVLDNLRRDKDTFYFYTFVFFSLVSVFVIGSFDHYFITLQQGQLFLALILGLSWSRV